MGSTNPDPWVHWNSKVCYKIHIPEHSGSCDLDEGNSLCLLTLLTLLCVYVYTVVQAAY